MQRPAFFALGGFNIAKTDLVPLIVSYPDDADVVYNACECADLHVAGQPLPAVGLTVQVCCAAVKVVTFLTMPLEPEAEHQGLQVCIVQPIQLTFQCPDRCLWRRPRTCRMSRRPF